MSPLKWRDLFTERDGSTPCFVRIMTVVGVFGFIGLTVVGLRHGQSISYTEWATGFTVIVAGGAGAARLKLDTEGKAE